MTSVEASVVAALAVMNRTEDPDATHLKLWPEL